MSTTQVVGTTHGRISGIAGRRGGLAFFALPYARPPVGPLRLRAPEPPEPWTGIREATRPGFAAVQQPGMIERLGGINESTMSEDCLTCNVWTPEVTGRRPVMVWIHGGGFMTGSGGASWYDGSALALRGDVVVVTLNYRLGLLGFLHLGDIGGEPFAGSANAGLLDQIAALAWIRENAGAFGGDPDRVCIFGESAGAMSVGTLLGMPAAHDLFADAILQSGACANIVDAETATSRSFRALAALGLAPDRLDRLADLPVAAIMEAQAKLSTDIRPLPFLPAVDGETLPRPPLESVAAGQASRHRLLVGSNLEEMKLFALVDNIDTDIAEEQLRLQFGSLFGESSERALAVYRANRPESPPVDVLGAAVADKVFRQPGIQLAETQERAGGTAYSYLFTWPSPAFGGALGAAHTVEIPFVFDNIDLPGMDFLAGSDPARIELAATISTAWTAFAHGGPPGAPRMPGWPPYDAAGRATMRLDLECELLHDPFGDERELWSQPA